MSLRRRRPPQWLTLESNKAAAETIAITITRIAGAPDAAWRVVDGGQIYEYSGDALSHVVQVGPCEIECRIAPKWIATLNSPTQSISRIGNSKLLSSCTSLDIADASADLAQRLEFPPVLESLATYSDINLTIYLSEFPASMKSIICNYCKVYGSLAEIPDGMRTFRAAYITTLTGSTSGLQSSLLVVHLHGGAGSIVFDSISQLTDMQDFRAQDNSLTSGEVNVIIQDVYDHKDNFTYAAPALNIDGNNAAPDAEHIALIEELVADYSWVISYTLPS